MLRFSVEPGERRARYSAVYALLGVGLIPVSVLAVHLGQDIIHPITFTDHGANMDNSMLATFLVALAAMLSLAVAMYLVELRGKRLDERVAACGGWLRGRRDLERSRPMIQYVAAVYGLAWVVTLAYVVILNSKLGRLERELDEIAGTAGGEGRWMAWTACSSLVLVGTNHRHAPLGVRERLAAARSRRRPGRARDAPRARWPRRWACRPATAASCTWSATGRAGDCGRRRCERLVGYAGRRAESARADALRAHRRRARPSTCSRSPRGLDSLVPGEAQILSQIREALRERLSSGGATGAGLQPARSTRRSRPASGPPRDRHRVGRGVGGVGRGRGRRRAVGRPREVCRCWWSEPGRSRSWSRPT